MRRFSTGLLTLFVFVFFPNISLAQTHNIGMAVLVKSSTLNTTFLEDECSWHGTSGWGAPFAEDICAPLVWADDVDGGGIDSLNCDSVPTEKYAGKIVLIRRGVCSFGFKAFNAEKAGALAVIILNHYEIAPDHGCTLLSMGAGAWGGQVTIPVIFGCRSFGSQLDNALKSGPVEVCFSHARVKNATFAYHYATPLKHVRPLEHITFQYVNRSTDVQKDIVAKVDIKEPHGKVVSLTVPIDEVQPGADTVIRFPPYTPYVNTGTFEAVYSNSNYAEPRDTLRRQMVLTPYVFANDNFNIEPNGVGLSNTDFIANDLYIQQGSLYFTGPQGGEVSAATFGFSNIDSFFIPNDPAAGEFTIFLYDADWDGDGELNLKNSFEQDISEAIVGFSIYQLTGNEVSDRLLTVAISDFNDPNKFSVTLKPNHAYYLSVAYDGSAAGTGRCPRFSATADAYYLPSILSTPLQIGNKMYNGWSDAEVIMRLQTQILDTAINVPNILAKEKLQVAPNPADETLCLNISLHEVNPAVDIRLMDGQGRSVRNTVQHNLKNGTIEFQIKDLPSGTYLLWVRTAEGGRLEKIFICH